MQRTPTGCTLEGDDEAFEELLDHINEDLAEGLARGRAASELVKICLKIDPGRADWLGW